MTIIQARPLKNYGVCGPASALNNEAPLFDGTTGKKIKAGSGFIITTNLMQAADKALLLSGTTGGTPASGAGTRLMWIPAKSAFRAGQALGNEWDNANVGAYSFASGRNVKASGSASFVSGIGVDSTQGGAFAQGRGTNVNRIKATNTGTFAQGFAIMGSVVASGFGAFAQGLTFGFDITSSGWGSFAQGVTQSGSIEATGVGARALGDGVHAKGDFSTSLGKFMQLSAAADNSFAWGYHTSAVALTQPNTFYIFPGGTAGKVALGVTVPTAMIDIGSDVIRLRTAKTPASAGAAGNQGDECWDANYHYRCVATNTWKRTALSTW